MPVYPLSRKPKSQGGPLRRGQRVTPMKDDTGIRIGRPYGAVGILWRKSLSGLVNIQICTYNEDRIIGLKLQWSTKRLLILCIYMQTDCEENYHLYIDHLSNIKNIIDDEGINSVLVLGDWNAYPERPFGKELDRFCSEHQYILSDCLLLDDTTNHFTYVSRAHHSTTWLDHCVSTSSAHACIDSVDILYNFIASDHFPLSIKFSIYGLPRLVNAGSNTETPSSKNHVMWDKINENDIKRFKNITDYNLSYINIPVEALLCRNPNCDNQHHQDCINIFYEEINRALSNASKVCFKYKRTDSTPMVPGWNDYVKEVHGQPRDSFKLWCSYGRPRNGPIYNMMSAARARSSSL
ncbi:uncharacterized protein [Ptychodera flava]|uniref:uncharacterized protein n=1 Tax=Ptychodera flava TaxID=63121 RepID=UPI00396A71E6